MEPARRPASSRTSPARRLGALAAASALVLVAAPAIARQAPQAPAPRVFPKVTFTVSRAASEIKIDGVLDEEAWKTAAVVPLPYEWAPGDNVPPPVETECLVTYDAKNLYVAFRAHDSKPADIRAHLMDRDDTDTLIQDDHVGVMIDTFNDERRAFQFRVNPLGVQADAVFSEQDGVEDFSWDMMWNAVGRITGDGYIVEMAFPLKQLRFKAGEGAQIWGFEAFRSWPRNVRHRISSQPRDRNKGCVLCQENKIAGLEGLAQGRNVELDPTATFGRTDELASPDAGSLTSGDPDAELGLTGRWSVTSSMTLNGTINPDFSQVEADVAQLDVNQRFALFYPEKRPFFLEGIDYFVTPIQSVFTRTVADPYYGAKLTGKQGGNAIGVFVTRDSINNLVLPSNAGSSEASLDDDVSTVVGRYRRDVGSSSTIGALYAGREGEGYHNRQIGADLFWRPTQSDAFRVQYIRTDTQYPDAVAVDYNQPKESFGGNGTWIDYQHITEKWMAFGSYEAYDSGFRADTGFVPRVDVRTFAGQAQRSWFRGAGAWFNTLDVGVLGLRTTDDGWTLTDQTVAAYVNYTGPFQTQFRFSVPRDLTVYEGVQYQVLPAYGVLRNQAVGPVCPVSPGPLRRWRGLCEQPPGHQRDPVCSCGRVPPGVEGQPAAELQPRPALGRGRPALPGESRAAQGDLSHQRPHLRARHSAIHGHQPRPGPLPLPRRVAHAPVLLAIPLFLQAQSPDRYLRRVLGQRRRRARQRPAAAEPHVVREARVCVGVLGQARGERRGDRQEGTGHAAGRTLEPSRSASAGKTLGRGRKPGGVTKWGPACADKHRGDAFCRLV